MPELRELLSRGVTTVIVPFGSIEGHGAHLPLGADALLADIIGREVAARLGAVLAPTVRIGYAEQHMHVTGTLTLSAATLADVAFEIGESMAKHGFGVIALVSTHGGNTRPLRAAVERINKTFDGAAACAPEGDLGPNPGRHSGEWMTWSSWRCGPIWLGGRQPTASCRTSYVGQVPSGERSMWSGS